MGRRAGARLPGATSNVRATQHRLLVERLDALAGDASDDDLARLAAASSVLPHLHRVDKAGRCRCCVRLHWWWSRRRKHCAVLDAFAVAMTQPFDIVRAWQQDR